MYFDMDNAKFMISTGCVFEKQLDKKVSRTLGIGRIQSCNKKRNLYRFLYNEENRDRKHFRIYKFF